MKTKQRSATEPLQEGPQVNGGMQSASPMAKLLRLPQVLAVYPVGRSTWYEGIRDGVYPRPIRISRRSVGWSAETIQDLIKKRANL